MKGFSQSRFAFKKPRSQVWACTRCTLRNVHNSEEYHANLIEKAICANYDLFNIITSKLVSVGGIMRTSLSIFSCVCLSFGVPANALTYNSTILDASSVTGIASAGPFEYSINDQGDVARTTFRRPPSGNAFDNVNSIWVRDSQGQSTFLGATNQFGGQGYDLRNIIVLDDGSLIASRSIPSVVPNGTGNEFVTQILRVQPNGGTINTTVGPVGAYDLTVLAESPVNGAVATGATPNVFNFSSNLSTGLSVNDAGQVALLVNDGNGGSQVIRLEADGQSSTLIGASGAGEINLTDPDINNAGEVAWLAQLTGSAAVGGITHVVNVGDGTADAERRLEFAASGGSGLGPAINNDGTVVGYQPSLVMQAELGDAPADPANIIRNSGDIDGFVSFLGINDYGQVAYADSSGLYVDDELIVEIGGQFNGETVTSVIVDYHTSFNNNGSVVAEIRTTGDFYGVRFDTDGGTLDNPLVPFASTPDGQNDLQLSIVNGLGVDAPIWVDPIVATGFTYSLGPGAENFASLLLPSVLPLSQSLFDLSFDYAGGSFFGTIGLGELFDFTAFDPSGISEFVVSGIDISEAVDPTDPFVVGLTFVKGGFDAVLSIDAIVVDTDGGPDIAPVPLPGGLPLLFGGLAALAVLRRRVA
ncbi:hypothetical protein [Ruegeria sp. Ofav3-42]|uniref:hypothetical protein n=1 Tax=Ruegeria sp. Ofav3-42 TaxID=2917759 RepID=UPI001EF477E5|nr:hypothetical protein [Ruegeria sp. Ofav3-42]MCG7520752.1 hypothetical protein [Ruegeria sp. Ofav3-42]